MYSRSLINSSSIVFQTPRGGGYSHILTIRVCAIVHGMVLKPFCQEQGTENMHFRLGTRFQI